MYDGEYPLLVMTLLNAHSEEATRKLNYEEAITAFLNPKYKHQVAVDVDKVTDPHERSALFYAASLPSPWAVGTLLKHGGNPNLQDDDETTPLMAIIKEGNIWHSLRESKLIDTLKKLLNAPHIDVSLKDYTGSTACDYAEREEFWESHLPVALWHKLCPED